MRNGVALLGVSLACLFIAGITTRSTPWLTVVAALAACVAFYIAAFGSGRIAGPGGVIALAVVLILTWIGALVKHATPWLGWSVFGIAVLLFVLGILSMIATSESRVPPRIVRFTPP
jgi:hypothetical protein